MDAYDIFKKLTTGLKFKTKVLGVNSKEKSPKLMPVKKEDVPDIKEEPVDEDDEEISDNPDVEPSDSESENEKSDQDLQLVEGVKIGEKKKKVKKERTVDLQKKLELEEQNRFRNEYGIKTVGRHVPPALRDFSDLVERYNVSQALVETIKKCGYLEPTPIQRQALSCMLEDRQIFACAPTGSGKTAAFLVPILHKLGAPQGGPRALVLCPTRELSQQIYSEALRLSASTELRCSIVRNIKESKIKEREATIRKSDIIISTPNRLCYLLNQDTVNISLQKVEWLIIDEADKLFEGSPEQESAFRQQMQCIIEALGPRRRVALFSATHTPVVAKWCRHTLRGLINITVGHRNAATNMVQQELLYCGNEAGKLVAFRQLVQKGLKPPVLVFVQSKERAKQLFKELLYDGVNVDAIHAGRTQAQRDNVIRSFRVGRVWVLICTELLGRGMDFRGVSLVINYDFPPSAISYIHRVGRAGRAGMRGNAITFFTQDDLGNLRSIASVMKQSGCDVPEYMLTMKQNRNKRKKLANKAPSRDDISTILQKRPKRKLEDDKDSKNADKTKDTTEVKDSRNKKHRKLENGAKGVIQNGRPKTKHNGELVKRKNKLGKKVKNMTNNKNTKLGDRRGKSKNS